VEAAMTVRSATLVALSENRDSYLTRNEMLRQENVSLKELVVKLSEIIAKNVADQK
jgi:hypothetical protein